LFGWEQTATDDNEANLEQRPAVKSWFMQVGKEMVGLAEEVDFRG
jgi:hypothetical protein